MPPAQRQVQLAIENVGRPRGLGEERQRFVLDTVELGAVVVDSAAAKGEALKIWRCGMSSSAFSSK